MKNIHIGLSIYKSILIILILITFTCLFFQFIINPQNYISIICPSRSFVQLTGIITTIISSILLILFTLNLLFNRNRGITINEKGVIVNMNVFDKQNILIEWSNIKSIERIEYYNQNLIIIYLKNNDVFFNKINNRINLFMHKYSLKTLGSPITFTSRALKIKNNDELEQLLQDSFNEFKKKNKEVKPDRSDLNINHKLLRLE
ncbi:STM3941 family protein [Flavobacterium sp.]|uniref:STM3941 family protein n=1 Tax=Flavobacterium sp. TaxID=239 RepID=UPI0037B44F35